MARLTQSVFGRGRAHTRRLLQNPRASPPQLLICQRHVNHPVLVDSAEPHHRSGRKHIQDHFLRGSGFQTRRPRDCLRPCIGRDGNPRLARDRRLRIRSYADGDRATPPREFKSAKHVRRTPACCNAHDYIVARHSRAAQVARALCCGILRAFHGMPQRPFAAGDNGAHHSRRRAECRRTFRRVQDRQAAAGSGAHIEKRSAVPQRLGDGIHRPRNVRQLAPNSQRYCRVFPVQHANNFESGFPIEAARTQDSAARFWLVSMCAPPPGRL